MFAPLEGWRQVKVTDRHTAIDYAHVLRDISDTHFGVNALIKNPAAIEIGAARGGFSLTNVGGRGR